MLKKVISILLVVSFFLQASGISYAAEVFDATNLFNFFSQNQTTDKFRPLHLRYLSYDNLKNTFQLLVDKGSTKDPAQDELEKTTKELLNYFFVGIALPNDTFWVNLRPDSPDNIIDPDLSQTDVGKLLLEADLQLKKDAASFTSPQTPTGREFWDKLYKKAREIFGYTPANVPFVCRPWIVLDEIIIRETSGSGYPDNRLTGYPASAYIYKATLKVLLEEDYLDANDRESEFAPASPSGRNIRESDIRVDSRLKELNEYSAQLLRQIIIPKLNKDVNSSKRYAGLRQIYYSLIFSQWFKARLYGKGGLYSWLIDKKDLTNLTSQENWSTQTYFKQYQTSIRQGEYNLQEPTRGVFGQSVRSYISGGIALMSIPISRQPGQSQGSFLSILSGGVSEIGRRLYNSKFGRGLIEFIRDESGELKWGGGADNKGALPRKQAVVQINDFKRAIQTGEYQQKAVVDLRELPSNKKVILIGDLHANLDNLKKILNDDDNLSKIQTGEAILVILGDAVHSEINPFEMESSVEIMQFIMELKIQNPDNLYYLLGNHDYLSSRFTKGGVRQGIVYRNKLKELYGEEYLAAYEEFIKMSPLMMIGNGVVGVHGGPVSGVSLSQIQNVDVSNEENPIVNQAQWGRFTSGDYNDEDVNGFLKNMGQPDAQLIVGHSPQRDGNWHWQLLPNHHIIFAGGSRAGYTVVRDGKVDFIEVTSNSPQVELRRKQGEEGVQSPNDAAYSKDKSITFVIGGVNSNEAIDQLTEITGLPITEIERRARPDEYSYAGFLNHSEGLKDVLREDNTTVLSRGLTHQQLAEPLFIAMQAAAFQGKGYFEYNGRRFRVEIFRTKGDQESIFNDKLYTSSDYRVTDIETYKQISFSGLLPEYIKRYGFYEGHTQYRLDPQDIINFFRLVTSGKIDVSQDQSLDKPEGDAQDESSSKPGKPNIRVLGGQRRGGSLETLFTGDIWIAAGSFAYKISVAGDTVSFQRYSKDKVNPVGRVHTIQFGQQIQVGRDIGNYKLPGDQFLSKRHFIIAINRERAGRYRLSVNDLNSLNGTTVEWNTGDSNLPSYTGAGNTSIHKALDDARKKIEEEAYAQAKDLLVGLLDDLKLAQQAQGIENLIDKWNERYPSSLPVDLLIEDIPKAIAEVEGLLSQIEKNNTDNPDLGAKGADNLPDKIKPVTTQQVISMRPKQIPSDRLTGTIRIDEFDKEQRELSQALLFIYRVTNGDDIHPDQFRAYFVKVEQFVNKWGRLYPISRLQKVNSAIERVKPLLSKIDKKGFVEFRGLYQYLRENIGPLLENLLIVDRQGETLEGLGFTEISPGSGHYLSPRNLWLVVIDTKAEKQFVRAILHREAFPPDELLQSKPEEAGFTEEIPHSGIYSGERDGQRFIIVYDRLNQRVAFVGNLTEVQKYILDDKTRVVGFSYYYDNVGLSKSTLRIDNQDSQFEVDEYRVLDGSLKSKAAKQVPLELTAEQRYGPVDEGGFQVGGINSDESIRALLHITNLSLTDIEHRARPHQYSQAGFLNDRESLKDVLAADNQFVRSRGFTHQQLAESLFYAMNLLSHYHTSEIPEFVYHGKRYSVRATAWRGMQVSIFNDRLGTNQDYVVTNLDNGREIVFSGLVPYYIWRYGFYEGHTSYRVDPQDIIDVFFQASPGELITNSSPTTPANSISSPGGIDPSTSLGGNPLKNIPPGMGGTGWMPEIFNDIVARLEQLKENEPLRLEKVERSVLLWGLLNPDKPEYTQILEILSRLDDSELRELQDMANNWGRPKDNMVSELETALGALTHLRREALIDSDYFVDKSMALSMLFDSLKNPNKAKEARDLIQQAQMLAKAVKVLAKGAYNEWRAGVIEEYQETKLALENKLVTPMGQTSEDAEWDRQKSTEILANQYVDVTDNLIDNQRGALNGGRLLKMNDGAYVIRMPDRAIQLDALNTPYEALSPVWKEKYSAAFEAAAGYYQDTLGSGFEVEAIQVELADVIRRLENRQRLAQKYFAGGGVEDTLLAFIVKVGIKEQQRRMGTNESTRVVPYILYSKFIHLSPEEQHKYLNDFKKLVDYMVANIYCH